jgi:hypothetical protein
LMLALINIRGHADKASEQGDVHQPSFPSQGVPVTPPVGPGCIPVPRLIVHASQFAAI